MFNNGTRDLGNGFVYAPGVGQMPYSDFVGSTYAIGAPDDFMNGIYDSMAARLPADNGTYAGVDASSASFLPTGADVPPYLSQEPFDGAAFDWNKISPDKAYEHYETILDRMYSTAEREAAQRFSSAEAVAAYEREIKADSTKYQRLVGDLRAAGINPMVAFANGNASASGVSSSGATSSGSSASKASAKGNSAATVASIASTLLAIGKIIAAVA